MSEEVKPCPFCGDTPDLGDPYSFRESQGGKWGALVCCGEGPEVRTGYGPVSDWSKDAVREWNTRPIEDALERQRDEARAAYLRLCRDLAMHTKGWGAVPGGSPREAAEVEVRIKAAQALGASDEAVGQEQTS